jgi:hypothetical protein
MVLSLDKRSQAFRPAFLESCISRNAGRNACERLSSDNTIDVVGGHRENGRDAEELSWLSSRTSTAAAGCKQKHPIPSDRGANQLTPERCRNACERLSSDNTIDVVGGHRENGRDAEEQPREDAGIMYAVASEVLPSVYRAYAQTIVNV